MKTLPRLASHVVIALAALAGEAAMAAPEAFTCPAQLAPTQQKVEKVEEVPAGFAAAQTSAKHMLDGFRINEGPIETRAGALYDDVKTKRDAKGVVTETVTWNVPATPGAIAICGYSSTSVVLTHALEGYKQCTMVSRKLPGAAIEMQSASCR